MRARVQEILDGARLPERHHSGDAGFDLYACGDDDWVVPPLEGRDIPCGVAIEWPAGLWGFLVGRSSTFHKKGLIVNPAIIDAGFRGELFAAVRNITAGPVAISPGDRIAQIIPMPLISHNIEMGWCDTLSASDRGTNGFGSTGD